MLSLWLVSCPACGKTVTEAPPPGDVDFVKVVQCILCNRDIDANIGKFSVHKVYVKREKPDLLTIS